MGEARRSEESRGTGTAARPLLTRRLQTVESQPPRRQDGGLSPQSRPRRGDRLRAHWTAFWKPGRRGNTAHTLRRNRQPCQCLWVPETPLRSPRDGSAGRVHVTQFDYMCAHIRISIILNPLASSLNGNDIQLKSIMCDDDIYSDGLK